MYRNLLLVACIGFLATAEAAPSVASTLSAESRRSLQQEMTQMIDLLQGYHYSDRNFNDLKASDLLDRYLDELDKDRLSFLASDIDFFHRRFDRNMKSVYLFRGDVQPAFEIFDRRVERIFSRGEWMRRRFEEGVRFDAAAVLAGPSQQGQVAGQSPVSLSSAAALKPAGKAPPEPWAADERALEERWEKRLRRDILLELLKGRSMDEASVAVRERFAGRMKLLRAWDAQQVRELFLDSMLESFDAHSGYFSKESGESFNSRLMGSGLGLGLDFELHEGHVHVQSLVLGGPADIEGSIVAGERLLALQEEGRDRIDVSNFKLREISRLLEGAAGSRVKLGFGDETGTPTREVSLVRARHERIEGHATGALVRVPEDGGQRLVGLISLPSFYSNPEAEGGGSSSSADVEELVAKLVSKGASALVLDLRNNGGGVMGEALKTVGLFIRKGPVFQTRGLDRKVKTQFDENENLCFKGPLVVLVSGNSASASEAFSGTLQWYGRALIIGSPQTFGKGSAQEYIDLRTLGNGSLNAQQKEWGVLRLTRQLFYFPDGRSPQLEGVKADVVLPDYWRDTPRRSERELPNALPNEVLTSALDRPVSDGGTVYLDAAMIADLRALSLERQGRLEEFRLADRSSFLRRREDPFEDLPLQPAVWLAAQDEYDRERVAVADAWNALLQREGYPHERVLLASMERVEARHQAALRRGSSERPARVGRTIGGIHFYETSPGGRIQDVSLRRVDTTLSRVDPEELARCWRKVTGVEHPRALFERVLVRLRLALVEQGSQPELGTLFAEDLRGTLNPELYALGLRALMDRLVSYDEDIRTGRFFMDVRRREALRVAADWARLSPRTP